MENMTRHRSAPSNFIVKLLIIGILLASLMFLGYKKVSTLWGVKDLKTDSYSAIFLDNSQVYFGLIENSNLSTITLTDVYYFGSKEDDNNQEPKDLSLIKLGTELHGPEDQMKIFFNHILFIETLRDDSRVVDAIMEHQNKR